MVVVVVVVSEAEGLLSSHKLIPTEGYSQRFFWSLYGLNFWSLYSINDKGSFSLKFEFLRGSVQFVTYFSYARSSEIVWVINKVNSLVSNNLIFGFISELPENM